MTGRRMLARAALLALAATALPAGASEPNDPDVLGGWKGSGAESGWALLFLPDGTYTLRMGDSPTGARGPYIARAGRYELLDGQRRPLLSGTYRIEGCQVLVLASATGSTRLTRNGPVPGGGCGTRTPRSAPTGR